MLKYTLRAELKGNVTTFPIEARGVSGAVIEAHETIRKNKAADRRLERGDITLIGPHGEIIMTIIDDVETMHVNTQAKKGDVKKEKAKEDETKEKAKEDEDEN